MQTTTDWIVFATALLAFLGAGWQFIGKPLRNILRAIEDNTRKTERIDKRLQVVEKVQATALREARVDQQSDRRRRG